MRRQFPLEAVGLRPSLIERFEELGIFGGHPLDLDEPVLFDGRHFRREILALRFERRFPQPRRGKRLVQPRDPFRSGLEAVAIGDLVPPQGQDLFVQGRGPGGFGRELFFLLYELLLERRECDPLIVGEHLQSTDITGQVEDPGIFLDAAGAGIFKSNQRGAELSRSLSEIVPERVKFGTLLKASLRGRRKVRLLPGDEHGAAPEFNKIMPASPIETFGLLLELAAFKRRFGPHKVTRRGDFMLR